MPSSKSYVEQMRAAKKKKLEVVKTKDKTFLDYVLSLPIEDILPTLEYAQKNYAKRMSEDTWKSLQKRVSVFLGTKETTIPDNIKSVIGDIEPELVLAMIKQESRFDPKAKSGRGAAGLMQIMPITAKQMGISQSQRFNPLSNVKAGAGYIKWLKDTYNIEKAEDLLHAYNAGPGNWQRGIKPKETRNYINIITKNYEEYKKKPELLKADLTRLQDLLYPKKVSILKPKEKENAS